MGLKNGCWGQVTLRTVSLIIGWIYLIDQLFWMTVLVGNATFLQSDVPVQNSIRTTTTPAIFDGKFSLGDENNQEVPEIETMEIHIGLIDDSLDLDMNKGSLPKLSGKADIDADVDADPYFNDYDDLMPNWAGFFFDLGDKKKDPISDFEDRFSKLNEHFSQFDEHFSKLDDSFSAAFQVAEETEKEESDKHGDFITLDDILNSFQSRNKRDIHLVSEGTKEKRKISTAEFIENGIIFSLTIFVTLLLIIGVSKGYRQLVMIWIVTVSFLTVLYMSYVITLIDKNFVHPYDTDKVDHAERSIICSSIRIAINTFVILVVFQYYKELKKQGNKESNLKFFANNKPMASSTIAIVPVKENEYV